MKFCWKNDEFEPKKLENVQILMKNIEKIDEISLNFCVWSGAKESIVRSDIFLVSLIGSIFA